MFNSYIDKYGKEFLKDILNIIYIQKPKYIDNHEFRKLLIYYQIIKPTTKQIYVSLYHSHYNRSWNLIVKNGRGTYVVNIIIYDNELPEISKLLS